MADHAVEVKAALARLAEVMNAGVTVEVYLTASKYRGEVPSRMALADLNPDTIMYYPCSHSINDLLYFDRCSPGLSWVLVAQRFLDQGDVAGQLQKPLQSSGAGVRR